MQRRDCDLKMIRLFLTIAGLILLAGESAGHGHGKCKSTADDIALCLDKIKGAIEDEGVIDEPFVPDDYNYTVFIDIEYTTTDKSFTVCCKDEMVEGMENLYINPLDDSGYMTSTAHARDDATRKIEFWKMEMGKFHASDFTDTYMTLIVVDPDLTDSTKGTNAKPYLHNLVINIEDGDFSSGTSLQDYAGPLPPEKTPKHFYIYLLYEQDASLTITSTDDYIGDDCGDRCLFDIDKFVDDNGLTLVGINWFDVGNDAYTDYVYIEGSDEESVEDMYCDDGWEDHCDGSSTIVGSGILLLVSLFCTLYLVK